MSSGCCSALMHLCVCTSCVSCPLVKFARCLFFRNSGNVPQRTSNASSVSAAVQRFPYVFTDQQKWRVSRLSPPRVCEWQGIRFVTPASPLETSVMLLSRIITAVKRGDAMERCSCHVSEPRASAQLCCSARRCDSQVHRKKANRRARRNERGGVSRGGPTAFVLFLAPP